MKRTLVGLALVGAGACYHAPLAVPTGDTRAQWIAARTTPNKDDATTVARCPTSEAELVARAVARDAEAGGRRAEARALRAASEVSGADPLGLRITNFQVGGGGFFDRTEAALRFKPARPGTLAAESDIQQRNADRSLAEARDAERVARATVRSALARARAAEALARVAEDEVRAASAEDERVRQAVAKKAATDLALAAADLVLADARSEAAQDAAEAARWRDEALALAGVGDGGDCHLSLSAYVDDGGASEPATALESAALAHHPALDERWAIEARTEAEWYGARAAAWPWIDFVRLAIEHNVDTTKLGVTTLDTWYPTIGFEIALPIFQWGGAADDAALAARTAACEETRAAIDAVRHEVRAATAELAAARARAAGIGPPLDPARIDALRASVASGYADPAALATLERQARAVERRRIAAALAVEEARIRLDAALGDADHGAK